jgi:predicted nucleotidyltransferase
MKYGLANHDMKTIVESISQFDEIDKAILFGSRAKGNYKRGSDIDIAIYGENVNMDVISSLRSLLEDQSHMPYLFDVIDGTHLDHKELEEHIEQVGILIFTKSGKRHHQN